MMRFLTSDTAAAEKLQDEEVPSGPRRGTSQVEDEESFLAALKLPFFPCIAWVSFLQGTTSVHSSANSSSNTESWDLATQ